MKFILLTILIFLSLGINAQPLTIKNVNIDSIKITSHISSYQFDKESTSKGIEEELTITYNPKLKNYSISDHRKCKFSKSNLNSTSNKEIKNRKKYLGANINEDQLQMLIEALQKSEQPNSANLSVKSEDIELHASPKEIMRVANKNEWAWQFRNKYSMKEDNELFFKGCLSIDTFNIFLREMFEPNKSLMVTDYSNFISVKIYALNYCFLFSGAYPDPFKQPWTNNLNENSQWGEEVINLNINKMLEQILPDGFYNKESISIQDLFNLYIKWYFKRNNMAG